MLCTVQVPAADQRRSPWQMTDSGARHTTHSSLCKTLQDLVGLGQEKYGEEKSDQSNHVFEKSKLNIIAEGMKAHLSQIRTFAGT